MPGMGSKHLTAAKICRAGEGGIPGGCVGGVQGGRWRALFTCGTPWGARRKGMSLLSAGRTRQPLGVPFG